MATAKYPAPTPEYLNSLQAGDLVEHPKWGVGSILNRSGVGDYTKLTITFPDSDGNGQKKVLAKVAKLRKLEDIKPVVETPTEEPIKDKELGKDEDPKTPGGTPVGGAEAELDDDDEDDVLPVVVDDDDDEDEKIPGKAEGGDWEEEEES